MTRDINDFVSPPMWFKFEKLVRERLRLVVKPFCVKRDYKEQYALFLQGREPLHLVNEARKRAGLAPITRKENTKIVTWTINSKHVVNPDDERLDNDASRAIDFYIVSPSGKAMWDVKGDVNEDDIPDYEQCGLIAEEVGFRWGGRFKNRDLVHIEV